MTEVKIHPITLSLEVETVLAEARQPGSPFPSGKYYVLVNLDGTLSRGMPDDPFDYITASWAHARHLGAKRRAVILHMSSLMAHFYETTKGSEPPTYVQVFLQNGAPLKRPKAVKK